MEGTITISEHGREGRVVYTEDGGAITGHHEAGGGDVVAIVSMGSVGEWREHHGWALARRGAILRAIAAEVIRRQAPSCTAEVDDAAGTILLRQRVALPAHAPRAVSWVRRYRELRARFGLIGLAVGLVLVAGAWMKQRVLSVEAGTTVPVSATVRTDAHLATLLSRLQPYTPGLHRDPSRDRYTLSVLLVPLDGSAPRLVPVARDLPAGSFRLARVIGSDGRRLWVQVDGFVGVDPATGALTRADSLPAGLDRGRPLSDPPLTLYQAAGVHVPPAGWLGLHTTADLDSAWRPGRWIRAVESATDAPREARLLVRGEVEPDGETVPALRIRAMTAIADAHYHNASFLRVGQKAGPVRVADPDSVLMIYASGNGVGADTTLRVARVEIATGALLWDQDTGVHRFALSQILPGDASTAFVGTRPPVPGKVSEPLIVLLDHATGRIATHSLWR